MDVTLQKKQKMSVTIPREEYEELFELRLRYQYLKQVIEQDIFSPPPTRKSKEVVSAFRKTKRYSEEFLRSLERGLRRSSHFAA